MPQLPTFVAASASQAGTAELAAALPTGTLPGDLLVLIITTEAQGSVANMTPANWTAIGDAVTNRSAGVGGAVGSTRLHVCWKYAVGTEDTESRPLVADSGDHTQLQMLAFRNVNQDPTLVINTYAESALLTASTSVSVPGSTTTVDNCLVVAVASHGTDTAAAQFSAWANANLSGVTEIFDNSTQQADGGGAGAATGAMVTAGAYGATTATLATSSLQGRLSFAIRGLDDDIDERAMFCYPNFADDSEIYTPSFSGGSWNASFPLTNLKTELLTEVARSSTDSTTDAQFEVNLGVARDVRFVGLYGHNLSLDGLVRVRASSVAGSFGTPLYDSGWVSAYPEIYPPDTLQVGHPSYADRLMTLEDWSVPENRIPFQLVLPSIVGARYWLIEFDDTSNPDGYVEVGRLFISWAYQAGINFEGADLGWVTSTVVTEMDGGADFFDDRGVQREFRFRWPNVDADEALTFHYDELLRKHGVVKQLVFVYNPTDTYHLHRRSMICRYKETNPLTVPLADYHDTVVTLREVRG